MKLETHSQQLALTPFSAEAWVGNRIKWLIWLIIQIELNNPKQPKTILYNILWYPIVEGHSAARQACLGRVVLLRNARLKPIRLIQRYILLVPIGKMATSWLSELISWLWTWKPIEIYYVPGHLTSGQARPSAGIPLSRFASIWIVIMWYLYWVSFFWVARAWVLKNVGHLQVILQWCSQFHNHPGAPWWTPCIGSLAFCNYTEAD